MVWRVDEEGDRFTPTRVGKTYPDDVATQDVKRFTPTRVGKTSCEYR